MTKMKLRNAMPSADRKSRRFNSDNQIGVDFRKRVIYGRVVAELGEFKDKRGVFNEKSLQEIVKLGNAAGKKGLRSRFKHPGMSDDGLGKFLGRDRNFRIDGNKVRSDFYIAETAMKSPPEGGGTPFGEYVMELANTDPAALSSSLVLRYKPELQRDDAGNEMRGDDGDPLPPIWLPTELFAIDVVDTGAAVGDFLSIEQCSENDQFVRRGTELMEQFFDMETIDRATLDARLTAFKDRYLENKFGDLPEMSTDIKEQLQPVIDGQKQIAETLGTLNSTLAQLSDRLPKEEPKKTSPKNSDPGDEDDGSIKPGKLSENQIAIKIANLCELKGKPNLITGYLNAGMTIEEVKADLEAKTQSESKLSDDATGKVNSGSAGKKKTIDEKLSEEYDEGRDVYSKLGIEKEAYIANRKIELGESSETSVLLQNSDKSHHSAETSASAEKAE